MLRGWIQTVLLCLVATNSMVAQSEEFSWPADGVSAKPIGLLHKARHQDRILSLHGQTPGTFGFSCGIDFGRKPPSFLRFKLQMPNDAPWDLQPQLFLKDKDGLWFQASSAERIRRGEWQEVSIDLREAAGQVRSCGHEGAWNSYYATHIVEAGLRFRSVSAWSGTVLIDNMRYEVTPQKELALRNVYVPNNTPEAFSTFELAFDIGGFTGNPFDPDELTATALFREPSGKTRTIPAFFYQPYRRELDDRQTEVVRPSGRGGWRVRFTPTTHGKHKWRLAIECDRQKIQTPWQNFSVSEGKPKGFVRVSASDPRYFETIDEKFFYPIGENIHAPFDKRCAKMLGLPVLPNKGTYAYEHYFKKMSESGQNACIVWMANWWTSIEWTERWKGFHGLNDYNLSRAWQLDKVFESAEKWGIHILLVLDNHGKISERNDREWRDSPYNALNGGPCLSPEDFFQNAQAFRTYQKRLRYIVARWSHSPYLLGYELVSEINLTGSKRDFSHHPAHAVWCRKASNYLHEIDPYRHPVAMQYSNDWTVVDPKVASLPELDVIVGDSYKGSGSIVPMMVKTAEMNGRFKKPTFSAEFGGNWNGTTPQRLRADLHAGLWANAMTQSGGAPFFWWFDFIDRQDLYSDFKALAAYMRDEDRRGWNSQTVEIPVRLGDQVSLDLSALIMRSDNSIRFWIYSKRSAEVMPEPAYRRKFQNASLIIDSGQHDLCDVEYWGTHDGGVIERKTVRSEDGKFRLKAPAFFMDIAGKATLGEKRR